MRLGRPNPFCQLLFFALVYIGAAVSKEGIDTHLAVVVGEVRRMTLCDNGRLPNNCEPAWRAREERWRSQYIAGERSRLQTHARLWGDFLPFSRAPVQETILRGGHSVNGKYLGIFSAHDYWEADYACGSEKRIPVSIGDGPKWVCGPHMHPKRHALQCCQWWV